MSIEINGAKVLFNIGGVVITETVINTWVVMLLITAACIFLTRNLKVHCDSRRQVIAEWIVKTFNKLVNSNMGEKFSEYSPLIAAVMLSSALCSLSSLVGAYAPTSDLSTLVGWAVLVFILITYNKVRASGILGYFKGYTEPVVAMTPMNIISEFATPLSMTFRHFGNIASGTVVMALIYSAMGALSNALLGLIPGALGETLSQIPIFQIGLPAVFSLYFDLFSACIQAFIFSMLTMAYVSAAAGE